MRKKRIILIAGMASAACILLISCTSGKKKQSGPEHKEAESEPLKLQNLTALDIITDQTQFTPAAQDQSYQPETDIEFGGSSIDNITESAQNIYFNYKNILFTIPKNGTAVSPVCNMPECNHVFSKTTSCFASLMPNKRNAGLQYYEGGLYYVAADDSGLSLYKSTMDGHLKRKYAFLDEKKASIDGYLSENQWVLHRGYIYFWNEGRGIYRMPISNICVTELIMAMPEMTDASQEKIFSPILKANGSYIYFTFPNEAKGYFLRYNTESGQLEQLGGLSGNVDNFIAKSEKIYYSIQPENGIYEYDIATGQNALFLPKENTDFPFLADMDYIYVPKKSNETAGKSEVSADVYTWEKEPAGTIPFGTDGELDFIGSDENKIYYKKSQTQQRGEKVKFCYINKSEIAEGTLHEAGEFTIED